MVEIFWFDKKSTPLKSNVEVPCVDDCVGLPRQIEERFLRCATRQLHGVKLKKRRRLASVGMTGLGRWLE